MNKTINIMLIEDSPEYRHVIDFALKRDETIELTHTAGTAELALHLLQEMPPHEIPDLILLDLNLPGMSGIEALPELQKEHPNTKIIILTRSNQESDVVDAISLGASGYLLKSAGIKEIKKGIKTVMDGGASLDTNIAKYILGALRITPSKAGGTNPLTEREVEILSLLADGLVKKEIATHLDISFFTVNSHVRHIYEKLNVPNGPAAIHSAHRLGLFPSQD
jgi:DNA-binding NarL/FixJ family response regulator